MQERWNEEEIDERRESWMCSGETPWTCVSTSFDLQVSATAIGYLITRASKDRS